MPAIQSKEIKIQLNQLLSYYEKLESLTLE